MSKLSQMFSSRRFRWTLFLAFLPVLGWTLYNFVPPQPRWSLTNDMIPLAFTPDDASLIVWDRSDSSARTLAQLDLEIGTRQWQFFRDADVAERPLLSRDRRRCLYAPNHGRFLHFADLESRREWSVDRGQVEELRFFLASPNLDFVFFQGNKHVFMLDVESGESWRFDHENNGTAALSPDHALWAEWRIKEGKETDYTIRAWNRHTREQPPAWPVEELGSFWISPDGEALLIEQGAPTLDVGRKFSLWDFPGRTQRTDLMLSGWPYFREFSPDSRYLFLMAEDGELWHTRSRKRVTTFDCKWCSDGIEFFPDGNAVALFGPPILRVCDVATGKLKWSKVGVGVPQLRFSPDGKTVAVEGFRSVDYLYVNSGDVRLTVPILRDAPDSYLVVSSTSDGRYQCIANHSGKVRRARSSFEAFLRKWLPAKWFPSVVEDSQVVIVDLENMSVVSRLELSSRTVALLSSGAKYLVTRQRGRSNDILSCWDVPIRKPRLWILGPPAALAVGPFAWKYRPWRRAKQPASNNANPHFLGASNQLTTPVDKS